MAYVLNYGFFKLKISGMYSLNTPRQTDGPSLIFASMYFIINNYLVTFQELHILYVSIIYKC
jgi:hypothetical protein